MTSAPAGTSPIGPRDAERILDTADVVCSKAGIDAAIARMAAEIASRLRDRNPVLMPILLGGLFTAVRLAEHFDFPCEFDRVQLRRYGHALEGGALEWIVEPEIDVRGRTVLIVDDILDRGVTLGAVASRFARAGAADVLSAVLAVKNVSRPSGPEADFVGVRCPDRFVFGCGMDYRGHWRGLPALYAAAGT